MQLPLLLPFKTLDFICITSNRCIYCYYFLDALPIILSLFSLEVLPSSGNGYSFERLDTSKFVQRCITLTS